VLIIHLFLKLYPLIEPASSAATLNADFVILWAAGKLAFAGQPLMVHDAQALFAATGLPGPPPDVCGAPSEASFFFGQVWACGQVLTCVRPQFAASHTPRARMVIRGSGP
jgi:hypothetical protein